MNLYIVNKSGQTVPRRFLETWVKALEKAIGEDVDSSLYRRKELGLVFLDMDEARSLNKTYRGKDYATDVLSFEGDAESTLGELVICPDVIYRQAEEHGLLYREELGYMVIHGVLHLLGFEHERGGEEAQRMYELQDRLFEKLCAGCLERAEARRTKASKPNQARAIKSSLKAKAKTKKKTKRSSARRSQGGAKKSGTKKASAARRSISK